NGLAAHGLRGRVAAAGGHAHGRIRRLATRHRAWRRHLRFIRLPVAHRTCSRHVRASGLSYGRRAALAAPLRAPAPGQQRQTRFHDRPDVPFNGVDAPVLKTAQRGFRSFAAYGTGTPTCGCVSDLVAPILGLMLVCGGAAAGKLDGSGGLYSLDDNGMAAGRSPASYSSDFTASEAGR
ncbi:hypothetical protein, partial [Paenibacillus periandrae]|uniref:hypothetical protein n=1 Tax=Paenibacillus periandrae TaxID=1761741 RepID=UPI001F099689